MEASLTCAVCLSILEEPVTLPVCSHNFCRACVVACLSQARRALEQPPEDDEWPHPWGAAQGFAPGSDDSIPVSCPLCRKVCVLPGQQGVAALPVNTTLAEVVKLFKASRGGQTAGETRKQSWESGPVLVPRLPLQETPCEKHPGKPLQLFCQMCCRPACGQCVSEEHQGVFHSVNLIASVYQDQKLNFFSYLKEIRKIHEQLVNEVAVFRNDMETLMNKEEEMIKREFEYICKTLEMKKQQLLDSLVSQKEKREKEYEIWKKTKDIYRKTIEKYLNDCEKIVSECDPQRFLEVVFNLNHRMKAQIDMIQISSHYENLPGYKQMHMDTTSVVRSIFALHLTPVTLSNFKDIPSRDREYAVFGNTDKTSEVQKKIQNVYNPMAGVDVLPDGRMIHTRIMSISETPEFGYMSHEEVRYNYYMAHLVHSDDLEKQTHTSPLNGRCIFPESPRSSNRSPEAPLFSFSATAGNLKRSPQVLQRQEDVNEASFSKSLFSSPAVNFNFSDSNNSFNLFNAEGFKKESPKTSLSETTDALLATAHIPKANAAALSFGVQTSLTVSPDLLQVAVPSVAVLNQHSSGAATVHTVPAVFSSSSGKVPTPSLKNENSVFPTVLLEKPDSQNSNLNNLNGYNCPASIVVSFSTSTSPKSDSTDSGKPFFLAFPSTSESGLSQPNEQQSSFSFSPPIQNKNEESQICFERTENNCGNSSGKKLMGNCNLTDSMPYKTCLPGEAGTSEEQSAPSKVSANYFWETNTVPVFSFPGSVKNNWDVHTSSMTSVDKTKSPGDKSKMESNDPKYSTVKKSSPSSMSKDLRNLMHSSSFFSMEKPKYETVVPKENVAHDSAADRTSSSSNLTEPNNQPENPQKNEKPKEDHIGSHSLRNGASMVNAESDGKHISQASNSSDSHTPSK